MNLVLSKAYISNSGRTKVLIFNQTFIVVMDELSKGVHVSILVKGSEQNYLARVLQGTNPLEIQPDESAVREAQEGIIESYRSMVHSLGFAV